MLEERWRSAPDAELVDVLSYIDDDDDDYGNYRVKAEVDRLVEEDMKSSRKKPSDFLQDLPPTRCRHCADHSLKRCSAVGGTASTFYGFNHAMPVVRRYIKGPMWLHFLVGAPPVIVFSSACAGLAGGAVPAVAQLVSSSFHAAMSSSSSLGKNTMHKSRSSIRILPFSNINDS